MQVFPAIADSLDTLWLAAAASAVVALALLAVALASLVRGRIARFAFCTLLGGALLGTGALLAGIAAGLDGYRSLAREETVARIELLPTAPQRFTATFRFVDGREATFDLAGDEIYVDAHILKWKPLANGIGLHTVWTLDRVGGRYRSLDEERASPRTLHALSREPLVDLASLRTRYRLLSALYDAQYGSATFAPADLPARLELRVSASGLLLRPLP